MSYYVNQTASRLNNGNNNFTNVSSVVPRRSQVQSNVKGFQQASLSTGKTNCFQ